MGSIVSQRPVFVLLVAIVGSGAVGTWKTVSNLHIILSLLSLSLTALS